MNTVPQEVAERCFLDYQTEMRCIADQLCLPDDSLFRKMSFKMEGNFYVSYPYLFSDFYPSLMQSDVDMLALAGNLYFNYLLILDELVDGDTKKSSVMILHLLHERAMERMFRIFPPDSSFWRSFDEYRAGFLSVRVSEEEVSANSSKAGRSDEAKLMSICRNKSAFAKCATAGLRTLAGVTGGVDPLAETQDRFHAGLQFLDDLEDWKEDYVKKRPSSLLSAALSEIRLRKAMTDSPSDALAILGRYVYYSGVAEKALQAARTAFEDSLVSCEGYGIPSWKDLVQGYLRKTERLQSDFRETKQWLSEKRANVRRIHNDPQKSLYCIREPLSTSPLGRSISDAFGYLMLEHENGFPEMSHRMVLPDQTDRSVENRPLIVSGDLFQRTVVLDAYLDINGLAKGTVRDDLISKELDFIKDSRMKGVRGGWNYFPGYPLLPPDSDDLAQIVALAARTGWNDMREVIDDSIGLLIESNRYDDGTFHTWILDPRDHSKEEEALRASVASYWGERCGKDIEVTANLAFALHLYDFIKYRQVIMEAAGAVARAQTSQGTWPSVWYCGKFYGTYVATRILCATGIGSNCLTKAHEFLITNQLPNGAWGVGDGDPLNSAFGIMSLCLLNRSELETSSSVFERAVSYLHGQQKNEGSWRQVPFISMFIGGKNIIYRSKTVTTAYVVKALSTILKEGLFPA